MVIISVLVSPLAQARQYYLEKITLGMTLTSL